MPSYTKPFLKVPELITLLEQRGMIIDRQDKAIEYLNRIGYYRLSAYCFVFRKTSYEADSGGSLVTRFYDEYKPDTRFQHVVDLYVFDKRLRLLVLDALERIEIAVRNGVILSTGGADRFCQHNRAFFHERFLIHEYDKWIANFQRRHGDSKEEFVTHFKQKYPDSSLPIWAAIELLHFSDLSVMYSGLELKYKRIISKSFGIERPAVLASWLHCLTIIRNICAHHGRLWNRGLSKPAYLKVGEIALLEHLVEDEYAANRLYASASIICFLLRKISPNSTWPDKFKALMETFPNSPYISLTANAGFPSDWDKLQLWESLPVHADIGIEFLSA